MFADRHLYQKAFQAYLRKGTPIERSIKRERPTTHYIWRTRGDGRVRPSHAENDGRVFAWDTPPATGHPGEDHGCRCMAEPYHPDVQEHITISLSGVSDGGAAWSSRDFVRHYYRGRGRGVTVRETGHLSKIVERYIDEVRERLRNMIARKARENPNGTFDDVFYNTYKMTGVVFSIGDTTIGGRLEGRSSEASGVLTLSGTFDFYLRDAFADPLDIGVEVIDPGETIFENIHRPLDDYLRGRTSGSWQPGIHAGEPYPITDEWSGRFAGRIHADPGQSSFG